MPLQPATPPDGYVLAEIHALTAKKVKALGPGEWRPPIHGTSVLVAPDGSVMAHVRTLGIMLPKAQRRYSLRVKGVMFSRFVPLISNTRMVRSDIAAYPSMKAAQQAGSELITKMIEGDFSEEGYVKCE